MGLEVLLHARAVSFPLATLPTHPESITTPHHLLCLRLVPQAADGGADHAAAPGVGHQLVIIAAEAAHCVELGVKKRLRVT